MKSYMIALGIGLLVGLLYGVFQVRSPAPPVIALVGLLGMLIGEQITPIAMKFMRGQNVTEFVQEDCVRHVFGRLPSHDKIHRDCPESKS